MKNIIFHHPLPLNPEAKSASGIRPCKMLEAFKEIGFNVKLVCGYGKDRVKAINEIKKDVKSGVKFDFVYSESSTMPTILTEPHHLPLYPMLDYNFFKFCKINDIPIGLFYRDIYWLFDNYGKDLNLFKRNIAKLAYLFDLMVYKKTLTKLFLPSLKMAEYIPYVNKAICSFLPPAHSKPQLKSNNDAQYSQEKKPLNLFYVGGLGAHYQMHELFIAMSKLENVFLTVCTREDEWRKVRDEYSTSSANIRIIHEIGEKMENELQKADIALLFVKPFEYREFASPLKLYEYIGFRKPIIATFNTLSGAFVKENDIGWAINYSSDHLIKLLKTIQNNKKIIYQKLDNIEKIYNLHDWKERALQVAKELTK